MRTAWVRDVGISYDPKVYISDAPGKLDALVEGYFVLPFPLFVLYGYERQAPTA